MGHKLYFYLHEELYISKSMQQISMEFREESYFLSYLRQPVYIREGFSKAPVIKTLAWM